MSSKTIHVFYHPDVFRHHGAHRRNCERDRQRHFRYDVGCMDHGHHLFKIRSAVLFQRDTDRHRDCRLQCPSPTSHNVDSKYIDNSL